jgi:hypothetical protein
VKYLNGEIIFCSYFSKSHIKRSYEVQILHTKGYRLQLLKTLNPQDRSLIFQFCVDFQQRLEADNAACARHLTEASANPGSRDVLISEGSWNNVLHTLDSLGWWPRPACSFAAHSQPLCWNFLHHSWIVLPVVGSVWYLVRNLCYTVTIDSVLVNSKTQDAFLSHILVMFRHNCPLALKPLSTPWHLVHTQTSRDSVPTDMLLSAVSVLVIALPTSEIPEALWITLYIKCYKIVGFLR